MSKQLIKPDLSIEGSIGNCKIYARSVFHIPSTGKYLTAWKNWLGAKYKHPTSDHFPDVSILCWFSGFGGAGHVVVRVPGKGYYSSPYSTSKSVKYQEGTNTRAVLPTIGEIERIYGVNYVGWTEDIEDRRVAIATAEGTIDDMTANPNHIKWLFRQFLNREPTSAELKSYTDKGYAYAVDKLVPARKDLGETINQLKACQATGGTVLKPGKYIVG